MQNSPTAKDITNFKNSRSHRLIILLSNLIHHRNIDVRLLTEFVIKNEGGGPFGRQAVFNNFRFTQHPRLFLGTRSQQCYNGEWIGCALLETISSLRTLFLKTMKERKTTFFQLTYFERTGDIFQTGSIKS